MTENGLITCIKFIDISVTKVFIWKVRGYGFFTHWTKVFIIKGTVHLFV